MNADQPSSLFRRIVMCVVMCAMFFVLYGGVNYLTTLRSEVGTCYAAWELRWPLWGWMLVPYCSLDLFFVGSILLPQSVGQLNRLCRRLAIAITIAAICYLIWPLKLGFAPAAVSGLSGQVFRYLAHFSQHNAAPSLHIALGVIVYESFRSRIGRRWLAHAALLIWFTLIGVSTMFTHQHHLIDLPTGLLLGVFCLWAIPEVVASRARVSGDPNPTVAWRYTIGAACCALPALAFTGSFRWFSWPAGLLAIVAIAYAGWIDDPFRKQSNRPWSGRILFAPLVLATWLVRWPVRRKSRPIAEIAPNVFVAARPYRHEREAIRAMGILAVVDLASESRRAFADSSIESLIIPLLDWSVPSVAQANEAMLFIDVRVARNEPVLIHCALGYCRTGLFAAAYLLYSKRASSIDDAIAQFRSIRGRQCFDQAAIMRLDQLFPDRRTAVTSAASSGPEHQAPWGWRAFLERQA